MESIYYIGIVQAWFAALLVYRKPNKGAADNLLMVWLTIIGLEMLYSILNLQYFNWLPDLIIIPLSYGPFLFFYAKLLVSKKPILPSNFHLHLIPAYGFVFISIIWGNRIDIDAVNFFQKGTITWLALGNFSFFLLSMSFYWWVVFGLIKKHNQTLNDHFSYRSDAIRLTWLKTVALWILAGFIGSAVTFFIFFIQSIFPFNPIEIFHLGLLIFTFSISYYGIHQPVLFQRKPVTTPPSHYEPKDSIIYSDIGQRLKELMIRNKPYLNNELTIQDLADLLKQSPAVISTHLNKELGVNFFSYVNGFRIEEAKLRLSNPKHKNDTLLAIAFDSGFNSKSSFNTLFKKSTGMTPSEFRNVHTKDS